MFDQRERVRERRYKNVRGESFRMAKSFEALKCIIANIVTAWSGSNNIVKTKKDGRYIIM